MLKTNRQNYAKRLRRLNRLMDAAASGANCADKIRTLTKSIWRFENKHYPLACKRCRVIPALRRQYAIDTDTRHAGAAIIRKGGDTRRSAAFMGHSRGSSNKSAQS